MNLHIVDDRLDVIGNRDVAEIHVAAFADIPHDDSSQMNRPSRSLAEQFSRGLQNPDHARSDSAASDKGDVEIRGVRHDLEIRECLLLSSEREG